MSDANRLHRPSARHIRAEPVTGRGFLLSCQKTHGPLRPEEAQRDDRRKRRPLRRSDALDGRGLLGLGRRWQPHVGLVGVLDG